MTTTKEFALVSATFNVSKKVFCILSYPDSNLLHLSKAIEIGADVPSDNVIDKWLGEPIKAAILPTSIFLTNKKGFPVLSKAHQRIIFRLFKVSAVACCSLMFLTLPCELYFLLVHSSSSRSLYLLGQVATVTRSSAPTCST